MHDLDIETQLRSTLRTDAEALPFTITAPNWNDDSRCADAPAMAVACRSWRPASRRWRSERSSFWSAVGCGCPRSDSRALPR